MREYVRGWEMCFEVIGMNRNMKQLVFGVCVGLLVLGAFVGAASATDWYVNPGESIQAAVVVASPGDMIIVRDGTYTENVDVNKRLTIESENGADKTIVQAADANDTVFEVTTDYGNISGFTVANNTYGMCLCNVEHCDISYNTISTFLGINVSNSFNNLIISNKMTGGGIGIDLDSSNNNLLISNSIPSSLFGINLRNSSHNGIFFSDIASDIWAIKLYNSSDNSILFSDIDSDIWAIKLYNSSDNSILFSDIVRSIYAIEFSGSADNIVRHNNIDSNVFGIYLRNSSNNKIYQNNFINNGYGILGSFSDNIWNSTEKITYTHNSNTFTSHLGNYWDDYPEKYPSANEIDSTGIWDTPYIIGEDEDSYSLVEPFENYIPTVEKPDLKVTNINLVPDPLVLGENLYVLATVKNIGNIKIDSLHDFEIILKDDASLLGIHTIPALENGEWILPQTHIGQRSVELEPNQEKEYCVGFVLSDNIAYRNIMANTIAVNVSSSDYQDSDSSNNYCEKEILVNLNPDSQWNCLYLSIQQAISNIILPHYIKQVKITPNIENKYILSLYELNKNDLKLSANDYASVLLLIIDGQSLNPIEFLSNILEGIVEWGKCITDNLLFFLQLNRYITDMAANAFVVESPADILITNEHGQQIGYYQGQIINEMGDNATVIVHNDKKYILIFEQMRSDFNITLCGTDTGAVNYYMGLSMPSSDVVYGYTNISVNPNTKATIEIEPGITNYTMSIDYDGDGVYETNILPDVNETITITPLRGDLNEDGQITPTDAAIALKLAATGGWDPAADVNRDRRITSLDALMIMQAATGAIEL
jgi:parallel beta-helix repeat protein